MRVSTLSIISFVVMASVTALLAQGPQARPENGVSATTSAVTQPAAQLSTDKEVDDVIKLVQAKMSEALILKTIERQNKAYDLSPDDLVRLQKAGVSEKIINAMLSPSSVSSAPSPSASSASQTVPASTSTASAPISNARSSTPPASAGPGRAGTQLAASASGCPPQTSAANTTASQPKKHGGFFSSISRSLKASAENTVDDTEASANCAINSSVEGAQSRVDNSVSNATAVPAQKVNATTPTASDKAGKKKK